MWARLMLFLPGAAAFASTIPEKGASEWGVRRMGVIFDCGSSGTRAHYFKWDSSAPDQPEEVAAPNGSLRVAPGISAFAVGQACDESGDSNHDGVCDQLLVDTAHPACPTNTACNLTIGQYIQPLLDQATDQVPETLRATTKLRMQATAGMRLLDSTKQAAIWKDLAAAASTTDFDFEAAEDAFTLAGDYEGIFGWLAVQSVNGLPITQTYGWMDLGGASTQIAFEPEDRVITENGVAVQSEYSNRPRTSYVYSISYMLSGLDQGQLRVAQYLYNQSSAVDEVANPCFNPGYNESMQVCEGIALGSSSTCSGPKRDVMFVGTGDYEECRSVIEAAIMHKNYQCLQEPCAVAGRYQPKVGNMTFFAGSHFFHTAQGLGLPTGKGTYVKTYQIVSAGSDFCSTEWSAIGVTKYRSDKNSKDYCFASAYIPAMLDAYGIDPDKDTVTYASSVGNEALEWPLGCQLYNNLMGMANVGMPLRVVNDHAKAEL